MGEIAINPIHNVHKKYRTMNLVNSYIFAPPVDLSTNTEIGGVSATISTPALLASKLGISVGAISNFTIVGSDIKCRITGSYAIPATAFSYIGTPCTYYTDTDKLVNYVSAAAFYLTGVAGECNFENATTVENDALRTTNFTKFLLKNATSIGNNCFHSSNKSDEYYIPNCTSLGSTAGNNDVFQGMKFGAIIYANPALATNNGGAPDGDIAYAITQGATIRYVTNFTVPSSITTLAAGNIYNTAVQLNFTPPSSTNTIEYYEVYANGVKKNNITASGQYITGLSASTSYNFTVVAVDIFYNKSVVSNTLSVTTTNRSAVDTDAIAYISVSSNSAYQDIIDDLFTSLKSNSLYTKLQAFYPFLGTTAAQHKWNGKNPLDTNAVFRLTFSGTATFSDLGYTPNGSTGYANTNFIPSINQNVNSNGLTIVCGTNNATIGSDVVDFGSYSSGAQKSHIIVKNNNSTYARIVGLNSNNISLTGINESRGIFTGVKQSATVTDFFINGSQSGTTNGGGTLPTVSCYIGAMNLSGSPYGYSNQRIQFTAIHEGLSDSEVVILHTIIDTFENTLGRKTW